MYLARNKAIPDIRYSNLMLLQHVGKADIDTTQLIQTNVGTIRKDSYDSGHTLTRNTYIIHIVFIKARIFLDKIGNLLIEERLSSTDSRNMI
jgi:hypothetical protein